MSYIIVFGKYFNTSSSLELDTRPVSSLHEVYEVYKRSALYTSLVGLFLLPTMRTS